MNEQSNKHVVLGIILGTVILFGGLTWLVAKSPSDGGSREEEVVFQDASDPFVGPADSKVVVRVYGDFQCPACRAAEPAFKQAITQFADRVKFIWKDFPLEAIHPNARLAANAARCAQVQQKYVAYHDVLYQTQNEWSSLRDPASKFIEYAGRVGLVGDAFSSCLSSRAENGKVSSNVSEGSRNNVSGTPTFFVNNVRYPVMSASEWQRVLNSALQNAASTSTTTANP